MEKVRNEVELISGKVCGNKRGWGVYIYKVVLFIVFLNR